MEQVQRPPSRATFGQPDLDVQAALGDDALVLADGLGRPDVDRRQPVEARRRAVARRIAVAVHTVVVDHGAIGLKTRPVAAFG